MLVFLHYLENVLACQTREVRLVNGSNYREGRVEICIDGRWGTVCSDHQTEKQEIAEAICTELGFPSEGTKVITTLGHNLCIGMQKSE